MKKLSFVSILAVAVCGCASGPEIDMNKVAEKFYTQPRSYKTLEISGVTELNVKGSNINLSLQSELQPLSIIPKDNGTAGIIANAVKDTVLVGAGILTAGGVMKDLAKQPQVVPAQIVRPEVITVPAGN
jgi:hypothetical protein